MPCSFSECWVLNYRYPLYRRLGGSQGRSGQVRKILPTPGFDPRTVQHVVSRYTDYATRPTISIRKSNMSMFAAFLWWSTMPLRYVEVKTFWTVLNPACLISIRIFHRDYCWQPALRSRDSVGKFTKKKSLFLPDIEIRSCTKINRPFSDSAVVRGKLTVGHLYRHCYCWWIQWFNIDIFRQCIRPVLFSCYAVLFSWTWKAPDSST